LKGQLMVDENGEQVAGFQVHLGGALGLEAGLGRKLRAHKVAAVDLADYIERLVRRYLDERTNGESFATWVTRADEEVLR
ncbi:MAG TPA: nitrite/sulfite reductase, partial [Nocardioidaceae bacterium]|nr:nitrite/sulfite reductase [Nocardioidaceae bacterium]